MHDFEFQIIHLTGVENGKPDALYRRSEFHTAKGGQGYKPVERVLNPGQWIQNDFSEDTEVIVSSVIIQGIHPVVKYLRTWRWKLARKWQMT